LHLAAHDFSGERARAFLFNRALGWDDVALFDAHFLLPAPAAAAACSRCTVFSRAMLRRTFVNWSGFGDCPVARCMRSANCSLRSFSSSSDSSAADLPRNCLASISESAVLRTMWKPTTWSQRDGTLHAQWSHRLLPSRRAPYRDAHAPPSTRRYPC